MPTYDFDDRVAVVTGAASGIGRATALRLADAGATVVCADRREDPKDVDAETPTHERIRERGGSAEYVDCDVAAPEDVAAVVEAARELGGVDVMVNNAGIAGSPPLLEADADALDRLHAVNVRGVFLGTRAAASDMRERDAGGVILNTASISSNLAQGGSTLYEATKGAVRMLTRGAALDLAPEIRVNAAAPGQIATEIVDGWTESARETAREGDLLKPVPAGRAGTPGEVAEAFCWLASDAAGYVTGELLHVDGGWQIC